MSARLFRRWTSVEGLELNSWDHRHDQAWTPLLNKTEKPLRSQLTSYTPVHDEDTHTRRGTDNSNILTIPSSIAASKIPLCRQITLPETPHHIFESKHKRYVVYIVSFAGFFSPLSSNIYFPALGSIARVSKPPSIFFSREKRPDFDMGAAIFRARC